MAKLEAMYFAEILRVDFGYNWMESLLYMSM